MQTVRDADGDPYLLVKRSAESSRVRDPATGEERYLPNETLRFDAGDAAPLSVAASGIPKATRRLVTAAHDEQSLGLLVELADRGPISVVELLDAYSLCESDLHGRLSELRAARLIEEATVYGERGYDATEETRRAVESLRSGAIDPDQKSE
ncbi:DUF7346 family protein [Halobellus captivus]|uniref:DUF7346 family protein n=1 Tax=Halobellus captivus TaxID=2592614 RepID=UPI0011A0BD7E|nr:hypothetical protein [Halobellus captivus]